MQGAQENHTRAWEKKKTIWKPQKHEQFLNQNEKATCLKNMKKQKSKKAMCLKNENINKQSKNLKAWTGIGIDFLKFNSIPILN
jgi:hypothetical protein